MFIETIPNLLPLDLPSISFFNQLDVYNYNATRVDLHIAPAKLTGRKCLQNSGTNYLERYECQLQKLQIPGYVKES